MNSGRLKAEKRRVRQAVLARRDALSAQERERLGAAVTERALSLPELRAPTTVMAFWAFGSELPTMPLIEGLIARGVQVALPRIVGADVHPHAWRPGDPTTVTSFGAREPSAGRPIDPTQIDVVITPAVAFDRAGHRIGYGGGFYDRFFLRTRTDAVRLGAAFGVQLVEAELPAGHFDLRVHAIVTESETVRCTPGT